MDKLHSIFNGTNLLLPIESSGNLNCEFEELNHKLKRVICNNLEFRAMVGNAIADKLFFTFDLSIYDPLLDYSVSNPYIAFLTVDIGIEHTDILIMYETDSSLAPYNPTSNPFFVPTIIKRDTHGQSVLFTPLKLSSITKTNPQTMLQYDGEQQDGISFEEAVINILKENPIKIRMR